MKAECSIDGCEATAHARGWCNRHYLRWKKHGDPLRVDPPHTLPIMRGADNPKWKGDRAKYGAVHRRLHRYRGKASDHQCQQCSAQAEDWAYSRQDPNELMDEATGFPYSTDLKQYWPLCRPCHYRLDREAAA